MMVVASMKYPPHSTHMRCGFSSVILILVVRCILARGEAALQHTRPGRAAQRGRVPGAGPGGGRRRRAGPAPRRPRRGGR